MVHVCKNTVLDQSTAVDTYEYTARVFPVRTAFATQLMSASYSRNSLEGRLAPLTCTTARLWESLFAFASCNSGRVRQESQSATTSATHM